MGSHYFSQVLSDEGVAEHFGSGVMDEEGEGHSPLGLLGDAGGETVLESLLQREPLRVGRLVAADGEALQQGATGSHGQLHLESTPQEHLLLLQVVRVDQHCLFRPLYQLVVSVQYVRHCLPDGLVFTDVQVFHVRVHLECSVHEETSIGMQVVLLGDTHVVGYLLV